MAFGLCQPRRKPSALADVALPDTILLMARAIGTEADIFVGLSSLPR